MISYSVEVDGAAQFDRAYGNAGDRLKDWREVWPKAAEVVFEIEADQFASAGARGASGKWDELDEDTQKEKGFLGGIILFKSGELKASVSRKGAAHQVYEVAAESLTLGSSLPYAALHQRGTSKMPARPVYSLSDADKRKVQKAIRGELAQFLKKQGFVQTSVGEI